MDNREDKKFYFYINYKTIEIIYKRHVKESIVDIICKNNDIVKFHIRFFFVSNVCYHVRFNFIH